MHEDLTPNVAGAIACAATCPLAGALPVAVPRVDAHADAHADAHGLDRRTFVSRAMLAAAALALAACGGGGGDGTTAPGSIGLTFRVGDFPALGSVGGIATTTANGTPIALVRTSGTTVVALSRICPHQGGLINAVGTGFVCSNHAARFTSTGTWTGGERTTNMRSYPTQFDATTGVVTVG